MATRAASRYLAAFSFNGWRTEHPEMPPALSALNAQKIE